jgi:serine/threonine protein kinase
MRRTPGGDVVLTDYGVGRIANAGVDVAMYTGDAAGTMLYLAPELIGGGRANTFASDVCVLGSLCKTA